MKITTEVLAKMAQQAIAAHDHFHDSQSDASYLAMYRALDLFSMAFRGDVSDEATKAIDKWGSDNA